MMMKTTLMMTYKFGQKPSVASVQASTQTDTEIHTYTSMYRDVFMYT